MQINKKWADGKAEELEKLYQVGAADAEVASALGITIEEFENAKRKSEKFYRAAEKGYVDAYSYWLKKGHMVMEEDASNTAANIWFKTMQNRFGWTEKNQTNVHSTPVSFVMNFDGKVTKNE